MVQELNGQARARKAWNVIYQKPTPSDTMGTGAGGVTPPPNPETKTISPPVTSPPRGAPGPVENVETSVAVLQKSEIKKDTTTIKQDKMPMLDTTRGLSRRLHRRRVRLPGHINCSRTWGEQVSQFHGAEQGEQGENTSAVNKRRISSTTDATEAKKNWDIINQGKNSKKGGTQIEFEESVETTSMKETSATDTGQPSDLRQLRAARSRRAYLHDFL